MKVAICICTCHRPRLLERLLVALHDIELGDLERDDLSLVVVDNAPTGEVMKICESARRGFPVQIHALEESRAGVCHARNRCMVEALAIGAEFVAFIDDDDIPQPDWLVRLLERHRETGADIVFGGLRLSEDLNLPPGLEDLFSIGPVDGLTNLHGLPVHCGTGNLLISLDYARRMSASGEVFSIDFPGGGEDTEFFIRAKGDGAITATAPRSIVVVHYTEDRTTLDALLSRTARAGYHSIVMARRRGQHALARRQIRKAIRRFIKASSVYPFLMFSERRRNRQIWKIVTHLGVIRGITAGERPDPAVEGR